METLTALLGFTPPVEWHTHIKVVHFASVEVTRAGRAQGDWASVVKVTIHGQGHIGVCPAVCLFTCDHSHYILTR